MAPGPKTPTPTHPGDAVDVRVAVVVVNWNGVAHFPDLLGALQRQTRPADEVIVVDNASIDDSIAWLAEHAPSWRTIALGANLASRAATTSA
jgi:GT2 family glycosyltransferase